MINFQILLTLLFFTIIITGTAISQELELATINDLPSSDVNDIEGCSDQLGNVCLYYHAGSLTNYRLYDANGLLKAAFNFKAEYHPTILEVLPSNGVFSVYYKGSSNYSGRTINLLQMNIADSSFNSVLKIPILESEDEELIKFFEFNNHFYVLTHKESSGQLIVKDFSGDETCVKHQFEFDPAQLKSLSAADDIKWVHEASSLSIEDNTSKGKAYFKHSILYITLDEFKLSTKGNNHTEILQLDMINGTSKYDVISSSEAFSGYSCNSYLLDTTLFRLTVNKKNFDLSVYNINTPDQPLKSFTFTSDEKFTICDSSVDFQGFVNTYTLTESYEILKKLSKGDPAIVAVRITNDKVKLLMGSCEVASSPSGMVGVGSGGLPMGGTYRIGSSVAITSFQSTLSFPELERTYGASYNFKSGGNYMMEFRSDRYYDGIETKIGKKVAFYSQKKLIVAYVDKKDKSIKIVRLK